MAALRAAVHGHDVEVWPSAADAAAPPRTEARASLGGVPVALPDAVRVRAARTTRELPAWCERGAPCLALAGAGAAALGQAGAAYALAALGGALYAAGLCRQRDEPAEKAAEGARLHLAAVEAWLATRKADRAA